MIWSDELIYCTILYSQQISYWYWEQVSIRTQDRQRPMSRNSTHILYHYYFCFVIDIFSITLWDNALCFSFFIVLLNCILIFSISQQINLSVCHYIPAGGWQGQEYSRTPPFSEIKLPCLQLWKGTTKSCILVPLLWTQISCRLRRP